jgi:hypothetical protein
MLLVSTPSMQLKFIHVCSCWKNFSGMGPGAWLIPSEVFSTLIRAKAMSVA